MTSRYHLPQRLILKYYECTLAMLHIYWLGTSYTIKQFVFDHPKVFLWKWLPWIKPKMEPQLCLTPKDWPKYSSLLQKSQGHQRIAVVTGGNGRVGSEVINFLNSLDFKVVAIGRRRPTNLKDEDQQEEGSARSRFIERDLSNLNQVYKAVEEIRNNYEYIDLLVCMAGVMLHPNSNNHPENQVEPHMTTNLLSHVQLFGLLRPLLEASPSGNPRAVFTGSATCHAGSVEDFLDDKHSMEELWQRHLPLGYKGYADSKLLLSLYVQHLGNVLSSVAENSKIKVGSTHPGVIAGGMYRYVFLPYRLMINYLLAPFLRSPKVAAANVLALAFDDRLQSGAYYEFGSPVELKHSIFRSPKVAEYVGQRPHAFSQEELEKLDESIHQTIRRQL